jgi:hypothetical protein
MSTREPTWLDRFFLHPTLRFLGAPLERRGTIELVGETLSVTDDPNNDRIIIAVGADRLVAGGSGVVTVDAHTLRAQGGTSGLVVESKTDGVTTTNNTQTHTTIATLAANELVNVDAIVTALGPSMIERARFKIGGLVYDVGGTATVQGTLDADLSPKRSNPALNAVLTVTGSNVRISVTGLAETTLQWRWEARLQRQVIV